METTCIWFGCVMTPTSEPWRNGWRINVDGLKTPGPDVQFLGGAEEMPAGYTEYFRAELSRGRYARISELPAERNMLREFSVD